MVDYCHNYPSGKIIMTIISSPKDLGEVLCVARKKLRLTQSQLALASGVGVRFIVDLESGKPTVWLGHVLRVIDALGGQLVLDGLTGDVASPTYAFLSEDDQWLRIGHDPERSQNQ